MKIWKFNVLMNEAKDGNAGGSGGGKPATPPATPPAAEPTDFYQGQNGNPETATPPAATPPKTETPKGTGYEADELKDVPDTDSKDKKLEGSSGYTDEEPQDETPETPEPEEKPADGKETEKSTLEVNVEGLEKADAARLVEFATKHGLSKEQAQAVIDLRKAEEIAARKADADYQKAKQAEITKIKKDWYNSLKSDSDFGGEKFQHNLHLVEKLLTDHLPGTKKVLTQNKNMLPPYVMKDLAGIAKRLYGSDSLVTGDPPTTNTEPAESGPLDYYTN
jgi:hypothetical protein